MTAIGFIGIGQMGAPMAKHLVDWGELTVCDARPDATEGLAAKGAAVAATPAEVAAAAEVISVMVLDDDQVREVLLGEEGIVAGARPATVVAIHSTIRAGTAEELAGEVSPRDIAVVDAPVSGGFIGAHQGTLAVMAGGPEEAVNRCREPFGHWASLIVHVGPSGAGTRAKLARNLMHFVSFTAALEAQRLAEAAGIDLARLAEVVRHSDGVTGGPGAIMFRNATGRVQPGDDWYDTLMHVRTLGEKDLTLALELGYQLGVDLPLAQMALERFADGLGVPHEEDAT
jgi:3-hydroxyisobutyrate dehydrogenase-like beta-hydroxyacid dehydrogenase